MNKAFAWLLVLFPFTAALGQYQFRYINHINSSKFNASLYDKAIEVHSSVRPLNKWDLDTLGATPSPPETDNDNWFHRKLFYEDILSISKKDFALTFNPIVNFQLSAERGEPDYRYINTRGFLIEGRIGEKFTFYTSYLENQGRFANYFTDYTRYRRVVPGQGSAIRGFGEGGFDYGLASGEISYSPNKFFSFTAGQGRNFFGEGYRSMLLSDAGFNYPFFRIQTTFWKIKYVNLWAQLNDIRPQAQLPGSDNVYARKYLSAHYLSVNVNSRLNLSFFEAIVLGDSSQQRGLDPSFFNPVIFYRPVEFAVGSGSGNALLGFGASYKLLDHLQAYGQFVLDEFNLSAIAKSEGSWVNKFGWQLGIKSFNTFGVDGLFTRLEYNAARPYTYSHREVLTNYAHYGTPLAHPWGANFHELIGQVIYHKKRWEFEAQVNLGKIGLDAGGSNWGSDVYLSYNSRERDINNEIGQGIGAGYIYTQLRAAWVANPKTGLKVEAGMRYRSLTDRNNIGQTRPLSLGNTVWAFAGIRTELFNRYYDY